MRAYCYASGRIEFNCRVPPGAIAIARGPAKALRAFITGKARHGYHTHIVAGRVQKITGSDMLLVPGVPEASDQAAALAALQQWCGWISEHTPVGVDVLSGHKTTAPPAQAAE